MKRLLQSLAALLSAGMSLGAVPHLFYTDLTSGPKSGGQNNAGAFVTLYGANFGAARGSSSVTIGGAPASSYPTWTDAKITIQLGPAAVTGNILVSTPAGSSNGAAFTVRSGNIYFVATNGSDSKSGKYGSPWRTLMRARDAMHPGDITYVMNGVAQSDDDGSGWQTSLLLSSGGTAAAPEAFVVYPQATATIGSITGPPMGVRSAPRGGAYPNYWVFAGFTMRGQGAAMALWGSTGWRIVANDFSCPNGNGSRRLHGYGGILRPWHFSAITCTTPALLRLRLCIMASTSVPTAITWISAGTQSPTCMVAGASKSIRLRRAANPTPA